MTRPGPITAVAWVFAVLLIAGIVHIASILLMPTVASRNSFVRLSDATGELGFHTLQPSDLNDKAVPYTDAGVILLACRYDLAGSPYRISVVIDDEALTSISFHARRGTVFHTLTDRAALRGRLDVLLGTEAQIEAVEAADADETSTREVRLTSPSQAGIVLLRAMPPVSTGNEPLRRRLQTAECRPAG